MVDVLESTDNRSTLDVPSGHPAAAPDPDPDPEPESDPESEPESESHPDSDPDRPRACTCDRRTAGLAWPWP